MSEPEGPGAAWTSPGGPQGRDAVRTGEPGAEGAGARRDDGAPRRPGRVQGPMR